MESSLPHLKQNGVVTNLTPEDLTLLTHLDLVVVTTELMIAALTADAEEVVPAVADHTPSLSIPMVDLAVSQEFQDLEVVLESAVLAVLVQLLLSLVALLVVLVVPVEPLAVLVVPVVPLAVLVVPVVPLAVLVVLELVALVPLVLQELVASVLLVLQETLLDSKVSEDSMAQVSIWAVFVALMVSMDLMASTLTSKVSRASMASRVSTVSKDSTVSKASMVSTDSKELPLVSTACKALMACKVLVA